MDADEEEEEEDYMSDAFLEKCQAKPGSIVVSRGAKRRNELEAKKKQSDKQSRKSSKKELEINNRESGLKTALPTSNKGFAMLAKMGYKEGMGIGRSGTGRTEPVPLELKEPRTGFGHESHQKSRKDAVERMFKRLTEKRKRLEEELSEDYHNRKRSRMSNKSILNDIEQSRRICYELDSRNNKTSPERWWFWPDDALPEDDDLGIEYDAADDELTLVDSLQVITYYLRRCYFYCMWCGTSFTDSQDLVSHCPGSSSEDHDNHLDNLS